jgi:apolipoprotein D and lipocalin family protein
MKRTILHAAALVALSTAAFAQETGSTGAGETIEPEAYAGLWYEIARTPAPFQDQCDGGVTASYALEGDGVIGVVNRCDLPDGTVNSVEGTAETVGDGFRRLNVDFPQSPAEEGANYVIEAVGPKDDGVYGWAVVRGPGEGFGWILSRRPEITADVRAEAEAAMQEAGLDPARLSDTKQPPQNYEPEGN